MELSYSLKEMDAIWEESLGYYHEYKESVDSLKQIVEELKNCWQSNETGSFEEYQKLFQEKYKKLLEIEVLMKRLIDVLEQKRKAYQEASEDVIESFE